MNINETELKQVYRESIASRECGHPEECPTPDEILSFFDPKVRRKKKLRIVDHISHCPRCFREFGFLAEIQRQETELFDEASRSIWPISTHGPTTRPMSPGLIWRFSGTFAGIVLTLASLIVILANRGTIDSMRGIRSAITAIRPVGIQTVAKPLVFEWQGARQFDSYVVEIFDASLLRLWSSPRTGSTRIQVPRADPPPLALERDYYWMVTGYSGGVKAMESSLVEFRLTDSEKRN